MSPVSFPSWPPYRMSCCDRVVMGMCPACSLLLGLRRLGYPAMSGVRYW